jgi:hypothetical protein
MATLYGVQVPPRQLEAQGANGYSRRVGQG